MSDRFLLGAETPVKRLGFGAMRIRDGSIARHAVELSVTFRHLAHGRRGRDEGRAAPAGRPAGAGALGGAVLEECERHEIAFMPWQPLGEDLGPPAQELRRLLNRPPVVVPIPGTSSIEHLEESLC